MKLDKKIEAKIKAEALKHLKARPNWDTLHVPCAVKWVRNLIKEEGGNEKILVPAMYLHDVGYPQLRKGYSYKEVMAAKKNHGKLGAERARKILSAFDKYFTPEEINRIAHLVANHDKHDRKKDKEEQLVFEADGLAQIDWHDAPPNFDKANCIEWINKYHNRRKQHMKTKTGIKAMKKLDKSIKEYIKDMA